MQSNETDTPKTQDELLEWFALEMDQVRAILRPDGWDVLEIDEKRVAVGRFRRPDAVQ